MPINGFNVGTDYSISYFSGATGGLQDFGDIQDVKLTALKHDLKNMPYNAVPRYGYVPDGFHITFTIVRTGEALEALFVNFSTQFNNGQVIKPGFLNKSINNPDGSVSRFQYTNFVIFPVDLGDVTRERIITQRLEGMASDMRRLA
jgi:hypothetical protein